MSIHSGHPEKYEVLHSELEGFTVNISEDDVNKIKDSCAWLPLEQ